MLNVILVDDEPLITSMLENLIDWRSEDMELTGIFRNGEEAWRHLRQNPVDIAIIDLTMPVMDGIELLKLIRLEGCKAVPVVLSSYQDFHLVRTAFMSGAVDYILKHDLNGALLIQTLKKLTESMNTNQTRFEFIAGCLGGGLADVAACVVSVTSWDITPSRDEVDRVMKAVRHTRLKTVFYYEQKLYAVIDGAEGIAVPVFRQYMGKAVSSVGTARADSGFSPVTDIRELARAVSEAEEDMANKRFFRERADTGVKTSMVEIKAGLSKIIRSLDIDGLSSFLLSIADDPCRLGERKQSVIGRLCQILDYTFDRLSDIGIIDHVVYDHNELFNRMSGFERYEIAHTLLVTLIGGIRAAFSSIRENNAVFFVKVYTEYNYDQYIDLQILAKLLYVSPATLGRTFHRETGVHYKEYLNNIRIRQAALLLSRSTMQVSKVAFSTGFQSAEHFSREFKKIMGVSPAVFRTRSD